MEQHKVLLIIVSVTVVLAAVVGLGLWLFYPRADEDTPIAQDVESGSQGFEWQPLDYLQGEGDVPGLESSEETDGEPDEFEVTYGVAADDGDATRPTVAPIIDTAPRAAESTPGADERGQPGAAGDEAAQGSVTAAQETPAREAAGGTTDGGREVSTAPAVVADTAGTTRGAAPATTERRDAGAAGAEGELADRAYWVQAISSPNRDTVEQAQLTLREHQLGSLILTKEINGTTYFRLRVGPFAVRPEAEKFLDWVRAVSGFSDAMIFVDYTTPVLAARPN